MRPRLQHQEGKKGTTSPCWARGLWWVPHTPKIKVTLGAGWGVSRRGFKDCSRQQKKAEGTQKVL